ncbi:hypothetical protein LIA77_04853 [Sarocladium implicatum]|nr:hypothetical protein LIA77_04853 [Sarocladium implicatum]
MATSLILSPAPYHIISYGTLLGASVWHSFVAGPVMFKSVDRTAFSAIQNNMFPIYFGLQSALPVVLALTFPGSPLLGVSSGVSGLFDASSRLDSLLPLGTAFITGLLNLGVLMPATLKIIKERRVKRDGKEWWDEGPQSEEMQTLNKRFGRLHGVSMLVNLATLVSTVVYGFTLGARMQSIVDRT